MSVSEKGKEFVEHFSEIMTVLCLGYTVENIERGQTLISDNTHGGYHKFHDNVHLGVPGDFAFHQAGKVTVGKVVVPQH